MWRQKVLAVASSRIAFASTLAIYVLETANYQLEKIFTIQDQNISCIEWEPQEEKLLASGTMDRKIIVWDMDSENIKYNMQMPSPATVLQFN